MQVIEMASPVKLDVVSPPTMSTFHFSHASLMPLYSSSMSSTVKRLPMASETVICRGVPFMAKMSLMFTIAAL